MQSTTESITFALKHALGSYFYYHRDIAENLLLTALGPLCAAKLRPGEILRIWESDCEAMFWEQIQELAA